MHSHKNVTNALMGVNCAQFRVLSVLNNEQNNKTCAKKASTYY